jgi:hypothetical protein
MQTTKPTTHMPWLQELNELEMVNISGGSVLTRKNLNKWLFRFQRGNLNLDNARARVNNILANTINRQASLDLSNQFYKQLTALTGENTLANRFYQSIGLPIPL